MKLLPMLGIILAGGLAGFGWAKLVGCPDGGCPLTATPWRGAAFGVLFGTVLAFSVMPPGGDAAPALESDAVTGIDDAAAFAAVIQPGTGRTVLADFYADWCGPCRRFAPVLATFANQHRDTLTVVKVNVDKNRELAGKYGVAGVPAILLFRDGKVLRQTTGAMSAGELATWARAGEGAG